MPRRSSRPAVPAVSALDALTGTPNSGAASVVPQPEPETEASAAAPEPTPAAEQAPVPARASAHSPTPTPCPGDRPGRDPAPPTREPGGGPRRQGFCVLLRGGRGHT